MKPWWDPSVAKDVRGVEMVKAAMALDSNGDESLRQDLNIRYARMFENAPVTNLYQYGGKYYGGGGNATFSLTDSATWNVLRSVIMTAASMIGRSKPRAKFTTTDGDYKQKRNARKANQFTDGWAHEAELHRVMFQVLIDSMVFDLGAVQLYEEDGKVKLQRVLASECRVDPIDALYGNPRTLYRRRFMSRERLLAKFGTNALAKEAIEKAEGQDPIGIGAPSDMLLVHEAWHLPSTKKGKDGLHVIAIEGCQLFSEAYTRQGFTIKFLRWDDSMDRFGGNSLAQQLEPMQTQLNTMLLKIEKAQHLMAVPRIYVRKGTKMAPGTISNKLGLVMTGVGEPPTALNFPAMQPEIYEWVGQTVQKMYDLPGINRNAAQGQKEAGVTSGAAIRESLDVQQGRMQTAEQRWEAFYVSVYELAIDMVTEITADGGKYQVAAPGPRSTSLIDWAQIKLDRETYTIQVWPASQLPITPQGKLDYVQEMLKSGLWTPERGRQALQDLDIDSADNMELAVQRLIESEFEAMLYDGKARHPDEFTPFEEALKQGGMYLAMGKVEGCPAKHLDLVRRYLEELKDMAKALLPPPPVAAVPGAPPPAEAPVPMPLAA